MSTPWLSVICPVFNGEKHIRSTLDSIATQANKEVECIIVDDSSYDTSYSIIQEYRSKIPNLKIHQVHHRNWVKNTNYAISLAHGKFICFLHQDDIWLKNRIKIIHDTIEKIPDVDLIIHPSVFIDNSGRVLGVWKCPLPHFPEIIESDKLYEKLLIQNFISVPGAIVRKKSILDSGKMDETLWYTADWDLWLKMAVASKAVYLPKPLSGFRVHSNSQTITRSFDENMFREQLSTVLLRHFKEIYFSKEKNKEILNAALFSVEINTKLAMRIHGKKIDLLDLFFSFISLGPSGEYRYLRDSRILERVSARIFGALLANHK